jgi:hypothetical protein
MASEKITAIIESVKGLTVLELKELIDTYCEEFCCCCCCSRCCWRCCCR